jgi:uncharacterized membrane protein
MKEIIVLVVCLFVVSCFILGLIFDFYSLLNLNSEALSAALSIFGLSIVIDFFALRILTVLTISLVQSIRSLKMKHKEY